MESEGRGGAAGEFTGKVPLSQPPPLSASPPPSPPSSAAITFKAKLLGAGVVDGVVGAVPAGSVAVESRTRSGECSEETTSAEICEENQKGDAWL